MCSLWYLPLLLAAYVFHSRNWQKLDSKEEEKLVVSNAVLAAKEAGKGFCMHEVFANRAAGEGKSPTLCPKVAVEPAAELVKDISTGSVGIEVGKVGEDTALAQPDEVRCVDHSRVDPLKGGVNSSD